MAGTIEIIAGTTYEDTITIKDGAGNVIDLTGDTIKFKIVSARGIADATATFYADTDDSTGELTISDAANGVVAISILYTTSQDFVPGDYKWIVQRVTGDPKVFETDSGTCIISGSYFDDV